MTQFSIKSQPSLKLRPAGKVQMTKKPVFAFIAAANVIYRDTDFDPWKIDLKKLIEYLQTRFDCTKVFYYGGVDNRNRIQKQLYQRMDNWGYELKLNPVKRFINAEGKWYLKADVDSRMTFDMMRLLPEYDRAVVMTGDGDFYWLLKYIAKKKDRVWLVSSPKKTAKELKRLFGADFANLDNLRQHLEFGLNKKETDSTNDSASGIT